MFKRLVLGALALTAAITSALARDSYDAASQLADVLVSEEMCGLTFDQAAIDAWISANVAEDDMEFTGNLTALTSVSEYSLGDITPSAKTARCAQVRRVSKSYGFTE
jgi:hypothetical protein